MMEIQNVVEEKLKEYFVENLNEEAIQAGLQPIITCELGMASTGLTTQVYPALYIACPSRTVGQSFFDTFDVLIEVAVGADTARNGEILAGQWGDILETVMRKDPSLGDSCISWEGDLQLNTSIFAGGAAIDGSFQITYTIGGHLEET